MILNTTYLLQYIFFMKHYRFEAAIPLSKLRTNFAGLTDFLPMILDTDIVCQLKEERPKSCVEIHSQNRGEHWTF